LERFGLGCWGLNQDEWDGRMDQDLGMNQDEWDERMGQDLFRRSSGVETRHRINEARSLAVYSNMAR